MHDADLYKIISIQNGGKLAIKEKYIGLCVCEIFIKTLAFLAHLSRRLTGELIGYPWIRRPSASVVRSHFKRLLL